MCVAVTCIEIQGPAAPRRLGLNREIGAGDRRGSLILDVRDDDLALDADDLVPLTL